MTTFVLISASLGAFFLLHPLFASWWRNRDVRGIGQELHRVSSALNKENQ